MKRWQRNPIRRIAVRMLDLSEWLYAKAGDMQATTYRRPPKPLCFLSKLQLMMDGMLEQMTTSLCEQYAETILRGSSLTQVWANNDTVKIVKVSPHGD